MVAYGEFRAAYDKDPEEQRIVFVGMRYLIENYIAKQWTVYVAHILHVQLLKYNIVEPT
jgi:hypothetical protein